MEHLIEQLQPVMMEAISVVLMAAIVYVTNLIRLKTGFDIQAKHRDALHSAIMTGVQSAIFKGPEIAKDQVIEQAIAYARTSVPQAISKLAPDNLLLKTIAERYVNQALMKVEAKI